jgi:hypothetical protein
VGQVANLRADCQSAHLSSKMPTLHPIRILWTGAGSLASARMKL